MAYPHCLLVNLQFKLLLILEFKMDRTTLLSAERLKKRKIRISKAMNSSVIQRKCIVNELSQ